MSSERSTTTHHTPSRLLIIWLAGFSIIGLIAALVFFNLVRDLVRGWNTTALSAPATNGVTVTNPQTGQPVVAEIPTWTGVERVTVLLLGIDERKQETGPFRTDTMLVLTIDPIAKTAGILSIPRDLWVQIPAMDTDGKINTAHFLGDAYNYPGGGPALARGNREARIGPAGRLLRALQFRFVREGGRCDRRGGDLRRGNDRRSAVSGAGQLWLRSAAHRRGLPAHEWRAGLEVCAHAP